MRPPGHRQSVTALSDSTLSLSPPASSGRRLSQKPIDLPRVLNGLLRNPYMLDADFASRASYLFKELAGHENGARISFEDTIDGLRKLELEAFVDGTSESDLDLGGGAEARRQLRLWSGSKDEFGVTDEQSFLWIAYRGRRFCDMSRHANTQNLFQKLASSGNGALKLSDVDVPLNAALASATDKPEEHAAIEELQSVVRELFEYHVGRESTLDFAGFLALTCDTQDRSALTQLSVKRDAPVNCVLRRDGKVTFMRPVSAMDFAPPPPSLDARFETVAYTPSPRVDATTLLAQDTRTAAQIQDPRMGAFGLPGRDVQDTPTAAQIQDPQMGAFGLPGRDVRDSRTTAHIQDPRMGAFGLPVRDGHDSRTAAQTQDPHIGGYGLPVRETRMF